MKSNIELKPYANLGIKKLNAFIDTNLIDTLDYDLALNEVLKFANYFFENKSSFDRFLIYEIVMDNRLLNSLLKTITENLEDFENLEDIFDDEILISLIRAYLMQNNLISIDKDEFKDIDDLDYYKEDDHYKKSSIKKEKSKNIEEAIENKDKEQLLNIYFSNIALEARYFARGEVPYQDLIQESIILFWQAIDEFDPTKNIPFIKFAQQYINQRLRKYIYENGNLNHYSTFFQQKLGNIRRGIYYLEKKGDTTTLDKLYQKLEITDNPLRFLLDNKHCLISYEELKEDELTTLNEESFEEKIANEISFSLEEITGLTDVQKEILDLIFGFHGKIMQHSEIAEMKGVTKARIYQIINRAYWKLLINRKISYLTCYLDNPTKGQELISKAKKMYNWSSWGYNPYTYLNNYQKRDFSSLTALLNCSFNEGLMVLNKMLEQDLELIYLRYGDDLSEDNTRYLSKYVFSRINSTLSLKMFSILNNIRKEVSNSKEVIENSEELIKEPIYLEIFKENKNILNNYFSAQEIEILEYIIICKVTLKGILKYFDINLNKLQLLLSKFIKLSNMINDAQENYEMHLKRSEALKKSR